MAVAWFGGWIASGVVASFFLWDRLNAKAVRKFKDLKRKFLIGHGLDGDLNDVPDGLMQEWHELVTGHYWRVRQNADDAINAKLILPVLSDNKMRIISWTAYWPLFIVLYFIEDLLVDFFNRIYDLFSGVYKAIQRRWEKRVEDEL